MTIEIRVILTFLVAFFAALFVLPNLSHIANRIGLIDIPDERKTHKMPRPLVGGIGIIISATFSSLVFVPLHGMRGYFAGLAVLLLVGFFDDFQELGHRKKFLAQILATTLLTYLSKVYLSDFGDLLGMGPIIVPDISFLSWMVTVFCVVGVTNAVNMIDGLDGLAGGVTFISFMTFSVLSSLSGNSTLMLLNLALAGAVLGFLKYNWAPSVLFMGDAGSLCLGFSLSFMAVALTQGESTMVRPIIVLLVLAVPISDTIVVMTKRVCNKKSPFKPDRTHLHHILVQHGLDGQKTIKIMLSLSMVLCCISLLGVVFHLPEPLLFAIFICYFILNWLADNLIGKLMKVFKSFQRKEKPQNCPAIIHSVFQRLKANRLFRGATRYHVEIEILCSNYSSEYGLPGKIINISKTGFLAHIDELGFVCKECVVAISFPGAKELDAVEMPVEHLWMSFQNNNQYHGFKFLDLEGDQRYSLGSFIANLEKNERIKPDNRT